MTAAALMVEARVDPATQLLYSLETSHHRRRQDDARGHVDGA